MITRFLTTPLSQRRWMNFKSNRRAYISLFIFSALFMICLFAEFVANDRPLLVKYKGSLHMPIFTQYSEAYFGGEFKTEAIYHEAEAKCLIYTGGLAACLETPDQIYLEAQDGKVNGQIIEKGWMIWPLIPYSYDTINYEVAYAPSPPDENHWLGTDQKTHDVLAQLIYGFRISTLFGLIVVFFASVIGIIAGAIMGYFGGWIDLLLQRVVEIWDGMPMLYVIIIIGALFEITFFLLIILVVLFSWTALLGLVRAEFYRARNFEYIRAAQALGVSDLKIMYRHVLPNAMVAVLTFMPFTIVGAIGTLTSLDFLGYGLPPTYPSLGVLALQAKSNLQAPWLAFSSFFILAIMLSLLVFIFEGIRDAYDPRKTFG